MEKTKVLENHSASCKFVPYFLFNIKLFNMIYTFKNTDLKL